MNHTSMPETVAGTGRYNGKNVVITGGGSGLGLATARLIITEGGRVLITGRNQSSLDAARKQLGDNAIALRSDVSSLPDIDALADRAKAEFGTIDALFANAGVNGSAPFAQTDQELVDELLSINVKGPYFTIQKLVPLLTDGSGVVITTSVANMRSLPALSGYGASKAALRSMTRSLAQELLDRNIRVNAVSPGAIDSGMLEKSMPQEAVAQAKSQMASLTPMQRMGTPSEIAKAVAFLAFDATFTTGAEFVVDGGFSQL